MNSVPPPRTSLKIHANVAGPSSSCNKQRRDRSVGSRGQGSPTKLEMAVASLQIATGRLVCLVIAGQIDQSAGNSAGNN
jgi:hypothetical protein